MHTLRRYLPRPMAAARRIDKKREAQRETLALLECREAHRELLKTRRGSLVTAGGVTNLFVLDFDGTVDGVAIAGTVVAHGYDFQDAVAAACSSIFDEMELERDAPTIRQARFTVRMEGQAITRFKLVDNDADLFAMTHVAQARREGRRIYGGRNMLHIERADFAELLEGCTDANHAQA